MSWRAWYSRRSEWGHSPPTTVAAFSLALTTSTEKTLKLKLPFRSPSWVTWNLRSTVAHNCHANIKFETTKSNYLLQKPNNHGKNKTNYDNSKVTTAIANRSQQKQIHHGKNYSGHVASHKTWQARKIFMNSWSSVTCFVTRLPTWRTKVIESKPRFPWL